MKELILLIISAAIVNNVVLSQFLGLCPFLGVSKKVETAGGMGAAVIFVITIASLVTSLIYKFILATWVNLFTDNRFYPCYCSSCTVRRDVFKEIYASFV